MPHHRRPPWATPARAACVLWALLGAVGGAGTAGAAHAAPLCYLVTCAQGETCEVRPPGVTAALPPGMRLHVLRGFTKVYPGEEAEPHGCTRVLRLPQTVSLDAGHLYGGLAITGRLQVPGVLRYEPNDGGEWMFVPDASALAGGGRFFRAKFAQIKLDEALPARPVPPTAALRQADCWQARGQLDATDFDVVVGDTSAAGTYARHARVSGLHGFAACRWGGP